MSNVNNPKDVRAWARTNRLNVGTRGRISAEIKAAFEAAQGVELNTTKEVELEVVEERKSTSDLPF